MRIAILIAFLCLLPASDAFAFGCHNGRGLLGIRGRMRARQVRRVQRREARGHFVILPRLRLDCRRGR